MDINKIIKEVIHTTLNEGYLVKDNRFRFNQQIVDSSFYNYEGFSNDYDIDLTSSNIVITWSVSFALNQMGLEDFSVEIEEVKGTYLLEYLNKQTDAVEQEIEKNIGDNQWKFQIEDGNLEIGGAMYIRGLNFDFKTNICSVSL